MSVTPSTPLSIQPVLRGVNPGHSRSDLQNSVHTLANQTSILAGIVSTMCAPTAGIAYINDHINTLSRKVADIPLHGEHINQLCVAREAHLAAIKSAETRIKKAEEGLNKLDGLPARVAALDQSVKTLESQKVALSVYNTKMQAVDSLMASLTASSSNSSNRLDTAERNISDLTTALSDERSAIEALQATVSALDSVPGTVKVHQQAIVGMNAQIEERKVAIEDLQKQMANSTAVLTAALQTAEASSRSKVSTLEAASKLQATTNETFTTQISSVQQRIAENEAQLDKEKAKTVSLTSQVGALKDQKADQSVFDEKVMELESTLSSHDIVLLRVEERFKDDERKISHLEAALAREESEKTALKKQVEALSEENQGVNTKVNQMMLKNAELEEKLATLFALISSSQTKTDAEVKTVSGSLQRKVEVIEDRLGEVGRQFDTKLNQTDAEVARLQESVTTLSTLSTAKSQISTDLSESSNAESSPPSESFTRPASKKHVTLRKTFSAFFSRNK